MMAGGLPRVLFYIQERTSGDLQIFLKGPRFHADLSKRRPTESDRVRQQRFSIHRSPNSPTINAIKFTKILSDGRKFFDRQYTEALKVHDAFAGVVMTGFGRPSNDRYNYSPSVGREVRLDTYDPQHFQPAVFIVIGNRERAFRPSEDGSVKILQTQMTAFSIVVMWQFLMFPSKESIRFLSLKTFAEDDLLQAPHSERAAMERMAEGLNEHFCYDAFTALKRGLAKTRIDEAMQSMPPKSRARHAAMHKTLLEHDVYLTSGVAFSEEHQQMLRSLKPFLAQNSL